MTPAKVISPFAGLNSARKRIAKATAILLSLALAGCEKPSVPPPRTVATETSVPQSGWRAEASAEDITRVDALQATWEEALARARRGGFTRQIAAEGALLEPSAGLSWPAPTPGNYMCRWIRLGSGEARARAFIAYREFFCHVGAEGDLLSLTKQTGSDRPSGYLFAESNRRMIFLGSLASGNDDTQRAYGEDASRDMVAIFERVGSFRFRLVIPRPRNGAVLEVVELTPAPVQRD